MEKHRYTKTFDDSDLKYIYTSFIRINEGYIQSIFQRLELYLFETNRLTKFNETEFIPNHKGYKHTLKSTHKYKNVLEKNDYKSPLHNILIHKVGYIIDYIANMLNAIDIIDKSKWSDNFQVFKKSSMNLVKEAHSYYIETLKKGYPTLLFIQKKGDIKSEYQRIEKLMETPLNEHIEDFTLENMLSYETDLLNDILETVNNIVLNMNEPYTERYVEVNDDINSDLYNQEHYGLVDGTKCFMNEVYYYRHKYLILKKSYITYFNLIFFPFTLRVHYSDIIGIDIDNKIKNNPEFSRNSRFSPYVIPQLYNYHNNKEGENDELQEYRKHLTISKYIVRQTYVLNCFMNIFKEMIDIVCKLETITSYHPLNKFDLKLSLDDSIHYFPYIVIELEKIITSIQITNDKYSLADLININIQKNEQLNSYITNPIEYAKHNAIAIFLPIIHLTQLISNLYNMYGQFKDPRPEDTDSLINAYKNKIDIIYTQIFKTYNIDIDKGFNDEFTELKKKITVSEIGYDYKLPELVLCEREIITKIIEYIEKNREPNTGLLLRGNAMSNQFSYLSKLYKYAYMPYILNTLMKPKRLLALPLPMPMENLFK